MRDFYFLSWFIKNRTKLDLLRAQLDKANLSDEFLNLFKIKQKEIKQIIQNLKDQNASTICLIDENYPEEFKTLERPPLVLCVKGDLSLLRASEKLSVVGSRNIDKELRGWFESEFKALKDFTIVSGGARGVDQEAHINAIRQPCRGTIVVLPSGLLSPYPSNLFSWYKHDLIRKQVLFVSHFHPDEQIKKMNFYPRNELLAAFSKKLLVLQANEKSGTMITAKYAADLGKEVYVLSCFPWREDFSGNKKLIEDGAYQTIDLNLFHF